MAEERKRILTGDRITGKLHLGHYVGSLQNRVKLQEEYETYIIMADVQALTTHFEHPEMIKRALVEVALDYLAVGLDPEIATILVQSQVPEIAELTVLYSMFVPVSHLQKNPTIKSEAEQYGYKSLNYGFLGYPVSQAADITFCKAHLVPVGEDQLPHIEQTRRIVRKFNQLYQPIFPEPEALVGSTSRLMGLDGQAKMSKSLGNAIMLSDDSKTVKEKIRQAKTDPARIHKDDPGHPEVCVVYQYHKIFNPEGYQEVEESCREGTIGCVACKKRLTKVLNSFLDPMRDRRSYYEERIPLVQEILQEGTKEARKVARKTMAEVREAMQIDYFADKMSLTD
ncbi:MAG: tryptophan--tRNA ligase [Halanaerobium sp.]|nr:tryptophan--tRNA ligase [Halanaerobium sp.]